jgi:hypothetical protein
LTLTYTAAGFKEEKNYRDSIWNSKYLGVSKDVYTCKYVQR